MSTDLGRVILLAVVTAVVGLLVMESYQTTPWLADRLMRWSVRLRYADNPERAKLRGEELTALLGDLPTLLKLPTAGAFFLRGLSYRLAHRRSRTRREPAVQRSLGVRFRIALAKAVLVVVCAGAVFGVEFVLAMTIADTAGVVTFGLWSSVLSSALLAGVTAAIESVIRPSRFPHGFFGGVTRALTLFITTLFITFALYRPLDQHEAGSIALCGGMAFGVATMLTCALIGKFKLVGVIIGILVNIMAVASAVLADSLLLLLGTLVGNVVMFSGIGCAMGVLAGFATAMIRMRDSASPPALADFSGEPARQE